MEITHRNPLVHEDSQALDNAYSVLVETLDELIGKKDLSQEEIDELYAMVKSAYAERKADLYLKGFTKDITLYLKSAFKYALSSGSGTPQVNDHAKLFYLRSKKHLLAGDK